MIDLYIIYSMNNLLSWNCRYLISSAISCKRSWVTENSDIVNQVMHYTKAFSLEINNNWINLWDSMMNFSSINCHSNIMRKMLKYFITWFIFENSLRDNIIRVFSIITSISTVF